MRRRILGGAIAAFVFILGGVSIAAATHHDSYEPVTATVAAPSPQIPSLDDGGREVENLADWVATVQLVEFATAYQSALDAQAAEAAAAAARQKAAQAS